MIQAAQSIAPRALLHGQAAAAIISRQEARTMSAHKGGVSGPDPKGTKVTTATSVLALAIAVVALLVVLMR
jgi:hypothetical protein